MDDGLFLSSQTLCRLLNNTHRVRTTDLEEVLLSFPAIWWEVFRGVRDYNSPTLAVAAAKLVAAALSERRLSVALQQQLLTARVDVGTGSRVPLRLPVLPGARGSPKVGEHLDTVIDALAQTREDMLGDVFSESGSGTGAALLARWNEVRKL
jgi:hypothetical protein